MDNYDQMAKDFLAKTNVKFSVKYLGFTKHFIGETTSRHTYLATFRRNGKQKSFRFGQSIAAGKTSPTAYDVLSCLQKYDVEDFETFCSEYGYDNEDRKSYTIYKAVIKEYDKVCSIWSEDEIDELREIQ